MRTRCLLFWPYLTHGQLLHLQLHLLARCSRGYLAPRGTGRHWVAPMGRAATRSSPAGGLPAWSCPRTPLLLSQTKARLHFHSSFTCLREGCWPHAPDSTLFLGRPRGAPGTPVPLSEKFGDAPARSPGLRLTPWFGKVGLASLVLTSKIRLYQCHLYVSKQIKCF